MSLHVLNDLNPEDELSSEHIKILAETVGYNMGWPAFIIMGYGDHLVWCTMQYMEKIGKNDIEEIAKWGKSTVDNKIVCDIYSIVKKIYEIK